MIRTYFTPLRLGIAALTIGGPGTLQQREEALRLTDEAVNAIGAAINTGARR